MEKSVQITAAEKKFKKMMEELRKLPPPTIEEVEIQMLASSKFGRLTRQGLEHGANVIAPERAWEAGSQPTANLCLKSYDLNQ